MTSTILFLSTIFLGLASVHGRFGDGLWQSSDDQATRDRSVMEMIALDMRRHDRSPLQPGQPGLHPRPGSQPGPRPGPGPRRQPFFVGTYRSVPSRDWQINMYQVYNETGFPVDYVNQTMVINIVDLNNGTFRISKSANNVTFSDLTFQLGKTVVVNGSGEGQYTFRASRGRLSVLSNSTAGLSRCDIDFDVHGHSNGVDVFVFGPRIDRCSVKELRYCRI